MHEGCLESVLLRSRAGGIDSCFSNCLLFISHVLHKTTEQSRQFAHPDVPILSVSTAWLRLELLLNLVAHKDRLVKMLNTVHDLVHGHGLAAPAISLRHNNRSLLPALDYALHRRLDPALYGPAVYASLAFSSYLPPL